MNAQVAPAEVLPPAIDSPIQEFNQTAAGLAALREQIAMRTYDCTTAEGDRIAREDRRLCVRIRTDLKAKHKDLKAPVLERGRLLDTELKRITEAVEELEAIPDAAIKAQEAIEDGKRAERQRIEAERQAKVDKEIARIANLPVTYVGATAAVLRGVVSSLEANTFEGMEGVSLIRAQEAKMTAHEALLGLIEARVAADAEREENERQRAENERVLAEQREQQRIDNERAAAERAEQDRIAREDRERLQREDDERRAEQARKDKAEAERLAAERAEAQRIEDDARAEQLRKDEEERAELRKQQDAIAAKERAAHAKREQDAIDKATLVEAAFDARELLIANGLGDHLVTRKLAAALAREQPPTQAATAKKAAKPAAAKKAAQS